MFVDEKRWWKVVAQVDQHVRVTVVLTKNLTQWMSPPNIGGDSTNYSRLLTSLILTT